MKSTLLKIKILFISIVFILPCISICYAQGNKNLAELLGYPKDSKLLIIHADDMGLAHSVNTACIKAFECEGVTSGSMMMPCPWVNEMASYVKDHPGIDVGIHLTLNSEWEFYKWGGVLPSDKISSLLNKNGYFYSAVDSLGKSAKADEARNELRAQINKAISLGIQPTHLDSHMGCFLASPELANIYLDLSDEYHLPILLPRSYLSWFPPDLVKRLESKIFLLDNLFMLQHDMITGKWSDPYTKEIKDLKPGLTLMIVHLAIDNDEMQAVCKGHYDYGSEWRQKDLDLVTSKEFRELLNANNIVLVSWRQIRELMK